MNILVIGHSHTNALHQAYAAKKLSLFANVEIEFLNAKQTDMRVVFKPQNDTSNIAQVEILKKKLAMSDAVIVSFFGNAHNALGLANFPHPIEFIYDDDDKYIWKTDTNIIPHSIIRDLMEKATEQINDYIHTLLTIAPKQLPLFYLEPPPCIKSETHIRKYPGAYSRKIEQFGVSSAELRKKLHLMHCALVQNYCKNHALRYIHAPVASLTTDGFLCKKYWPKDAAHGNADYGVLALENILEILGNRGQKNEL